MSGPATQLRIFMTGLTLGELQFYRQLRGVGFSRYDANMIVFGAVTARDNARAAKCLRRPS